MWTRRRQELARFETEQVEAQHKAERVERIESTDPQSPPNLLCPNCGNAVRPGATYCPNCRYPLSPASQNTPPTLNISPAPEPPLIEKALTPSTTTSRPQQEPIKEIVLDDLAIQATLQRLWDRAGR